MVFLAVFQKGKEKKIRVATSVANVLPVLNSLFVVLLVRKGSLGELMCADEPDHELHCQSDAEL